MIKLFIHERFVLTIIIVNSIAIFLNSFSSISNSTHGILIWIDYVCVIYFVIELVIKLKIFRFKKYWSNNWNRFDFFVVISSSPVLLYPIFDLKVFSVILILRLSRILRLFKVLNFIPNRESLFAGIIRALKASIGVFIALFFLNFLFAMGATILFGEKLPEHFGNPVISLYTIFKLFTVDGWYEIPDLLAAQNHSIHWVILIRIYFIVAVVIGGILGLSLANAVFVDEMTADNTQKAEEMLIELLNEIKSLRNELNNLRK